MHYGLYGDMGLEGDDNLGLDRDEIISGDDQGDDSGIDSTLGDLLSGLEGDDSNGTFVGDDYSGMGASKAAKQRNAQKRAMARELLRRRVNSGALLRSVAPRNSREYALGLGSTSVAGLSSANINVQPQVIFRPERLVIPSNVAPDFLITDLKVGKNSQLASTGALPAVMFTESAFGVRLKMDTAQISMFVTISVTNQSSVARNFQGGLVGPAVE